MQELANEQKAQIIKRGSENWEEKTKITQMGAARRDLKIVMLKT